MSRPTVDSAPAAHVRVMIVDDSALMRKLLAQALARDPGIEVVDTAMDGQFALDHLKKMRPDVVLMDIDMPRMDGLAALGHIVGQYGLPVVMCSTRTTVGAEATIEALARGAVDFIEKPGLEDLKNGAAAAAIASCVRNAAGTRVLRPKRTSPAPAADPAGTPAAAAARPVSPAAAATTGGAGHASTAVLEQYAALVRKISPEIVAIGTSTGGPPALEQVLSAFPADFPLGIVIVQHMPAGFTGMLAAHLNRTAKIKVREAVEGDAVEPGLALIAPGGAHMRVVRQRGQLTVTLDRVTEPRGGHRPSVDVLFDSVAAAVGGRAAAAIMTGMGQDGAEGMRRLYDAGAATLAQSPDSCICHGMPKSVIDRGCARAVFPLDIISAALISCGASHTSTDRR